MSERRTPKLLKSRLEEKIGHPLPELNFHIFRGIQNSDTKCYIIAILQLFFHSQEIIDFLFTAEELNESEALMRNILDELYSSDTKSISIKNFITNWRGWTEENLAIPGGFQDALDFFSYFIETLSKDFRNIFTFTGSEKTESPLNYPFLRVNKTAPTLRDCVKNAVAEYRQIQTNPSVLFIQLDRASQQNSIDSDYVSINKTIIFNGQCYKFTGATVYLTKGTLHYMSIFCIENEYFLFNDSDVSPLFLDKYSVFPSSYNRCVDCDSYIHRNSVFFMYEITDYDDPTLVHLSPHMQNMMPQNVIHDAVIETHSISSDQNDRFIEVPNSELSRELINVSNIPDNDLKGMVFVNTKGVPENVIEPIENNRYSRVRKVFKWISKILRNLKQIDQGKLNSQLILDKFGFQAEEIDFIQEQGCILYDILVNRLLSDENLTFNKVEKELEVIISSYEAKYHALLRDKPVKEKNFATIENGIDDDYSSDDDIYSDIICGRDDDESGMEFIDSGGFDEVEDEDDGSISMFTDLSGYEVGQCPMNDENCEEDSVQETDEDFETEKSVFKRKKTDFRLHGDYLLVNTWATTTDEFERNDLEFVNENANVKEDDDECDDFFNDDNQFILENYNWMERMYELEAPTILREIRERINSKYDYKKKNISLDTKSGLRNAIQTECLRAWDAIKNPRKEIATFARDWINKNVKSSPPHVLVQKYNQILSDEIEMKKKAEKKRKEKHKDEQFEQTKQSKKSKKVVKTEFTLTEVTIKHWIEQRNPFKEKKWGGPHNLKLDDEAIICLLCMALDFPNLPAVHYTKFLNSKYGPCGSKERHVTVATVNNALRSLRFSFKKAAFCPPARNYVGLRIFRVAWSLMMDEISAQKDVLFGFLDEAAVTVSDGKKYGRSYVGITPLINCPLSDAKLSVLACVLPGYGVLYKFFNSSVLGEDYASFLKDITQFIRKYICSSKTQIVFIEDNCRIHCTETVESIIERLKVASIPTVPYSPQLNGVVEGYFGDVKLNHLNFYASEWNDEPTCDIQIIRDKWDELSNTGFTIKKSEELYLEWKARMAQCVMGLPLVSGHVDTERFKNDVVRLSTVCAYRHWKQLQFS